MDGRSPLDMLPGALRKPIVRAVQGNVVGKVLRDHGVIREDMI